MKSSKHRILAFNPIVNSDSKPAEKEEKVVSQYEWVEVKPMACGETNYLNTFIQNHTGITIDYCSLDIPKSDPTSESNGRTKKFDLSSMHARLSKWGGLSMNTKKEKKDKENYDLDDSFIDDSETNKPGEHNPGFIEPVVEDFVSMTCDIKSFKKSNYYQERLKSIKKSIEEQNKKRKKSPREKSAESPGKKVAVEKKKPIKKRKRSNNPDAIERPEKELKVLKQNSDAKGTSVLDEEDKGIRVHF